MSVIKFLLYSSFLFFDILFLKNNKKIYHFKIQKKYKEYSLYENSISGYLFK